MLLSILRFCLLLFLSQTALYSIDAQPFLNDPFCSSRDPSTYKCKLCIPPYAPHPVSKNCAILQGSLQQQQQKQQEPIYSGFESSQNPDADKSGINFYPSQNSQNINQQSPVLFSNSITSGSSISFKSISY